MPNSQIFGQPERDPMILKTLGGYRIVSRLGSGATAVVYRAVPEDTLQQDQAVAIKVLHPRRSGDTELRARLYREFELAHPLDHPSIVHIRELGEQEERLYLVMDCLTGRPLSELMAAGRPFPLPDVQRYIQPLVEGLEYAHKRGVTHRDLKPDNVMITDEGQVKITDFGVSSRPGMARLTPTGTALGTPAYMAPEQITGAPEPRSDQYALGVILFQLLTGRLPFLSKSTVSMVFAHMGQEPPSPRSLRPVIPEALDKVVMRMLRKDPQHRFPDMESLRQALEKAFEG